MKKLLVCGLLSSVIFCSTENEAISVTSPQKITEKALFTGPLLAPSAHVAPVGHVNIESYIFLNLKTGTYTDHWEFQRATQMSKTIKFEPSIQIGLLSFMDCGFAMQLVYNSVGDANALGVGDLGAQVGFQLLRQGPSPVSLKISLKETFPTGAYQNLHSCGQGVDAFGSGAFRTKVVLTSGYVIELSAARECSLRFGASYSIPTKVHVSGVNAYGGDKTTNGTVTNAGTFDLFLGTEYSITSHWVFACDFDSLYQAPTKFKGTTSSAVGKNKSTYVFSIAPALEYNISETYGFIGGVWFSAFGYNHTAFINGALAFNVYF